jgi:hypothetical protein
VFTLTLTNTTNQPLRLLDIRGGRRPDLEAAYFAVKVAQEGRLVGLSETVSGSDPGAISARDYFLLPPSRVLRVKLADPPFWLDDLKPGIYQAFLLFWQDPFADPSTRCLSEPTTFVVSR